MRRWTNCGNWFQTSRERKAGRCIFCENEAEEPATRRQNFADGSALLPAPDGSMLILESELVSHSVLSDDNGIAT